jgi:hypothetical protein
LLSLFLVINSLNAQVLESPSKALKLTFQLTPNGKPSYSLTYKNKPVVLNSLLGVYLKGDSDLASNFKIDSVIVDGRFNRIHTKE